MTLFMSVLGEILKKIFVDQYKIRNFSYHMHNFAKKDKIFGYIFLNYISYMQLHFIQFK